MICIRHGLPARHRVRGVLSPWLGALILLLASLVPAAAQTCATEPTGPIRQRWLFLDGAAGPLGCPVAPENRVEGQKDFPGEKTKSPPTVAVHDGRVYLAWRGIDDRINLMLSNDGGMSFTGKTTFEEKSDSGPALASHNGKLFIAWRGADNTSLNVARVSLFGNTNGERGIEGLEAKKTLPERSDAAPALASHAGRLFIAWKGDDNDNLTMLASADDGATFPFRADLREHSDHAPSLASTGDRLLLAWKGSGNDQISVARTVLIANTAGRFDIEGLADKVVVPAERTGDGPALAAFGGRTFLGWRGGGNKLNLMFAPQGTLAFTGKTQLADESDDASTLAAGDRLWMAWRDGDRLDLGKALLFANTAGGFGIERLTGRDAPKMKFEHGEIAFSPGQGAAMLVAAYQQDDWLILNWGDTAPWNYDSFLIASTRNGQPQPQIEVNGFAERTFGFTTFKSPLPGTYSFSVEGCAVGAGGHDCPQRWTVPVELEYRLPPLPAYAACTTAQPVGLIAQRWAELGGGEGRLGCAVDAERAVTGGRAQSFQHGEIVFSPGQGEQMMLAVYQDGGQVVADWGLTSPFLYNSFSLLVQRNGQLIAAPRDVPGAASGRWSMPAADPGHYTIAVSGCTGLLVCPQGATVPASVDVVPPPANPPDTDCPIKPVGLIADRWTALSAKGGPLGCATAAESDVAGGRRTPFDNGAIVFSPGQAPGMVVAAFQAGNGINVDWVAPGSHFESFQVDVAYEGQPVNRHVVDADDSKAGGSWRVDFSRPEDDASVPTVGNGTGRYTIRIEPCTKKDECAGTNWTAPADIAFRTTANDGIDLSDLPVPTTAAVALQNQPVIALRSAQSIAASGDVASKWGDDQVGVALAMLSVIEDEVAHGAAPRAHRRPGKRFGMLSEIEAAARVQVPGQTGTETHQAPACDRNGEYDTALKGIVPIVYRYGRFLAPDVRYRLLFLLSKTGGHEESDEILDCIVDVPETENHLWMIDSSRFLANQLWAKRSKDKRYDNRANGLADYLIGKLQNHLKSDFIEYNSRPYTRYTWAAIQNLYDYSEDKAVKTAAQAVLDYLSVKGAVSISDGRRNPPYRRRVSHAQADYFSPQADRLKKIQIAYTAPTLVMRELRAANGLEDFARSEAMLSGISSYRPPNTILDLMLNPAHRSFYQRFNHASAEAYAAEPDFLLSAGGTRTDFAYTSKPGDAPVLGGILGGALGAVLAGPIGAVVGASGGAVVTALETVHGKGEDLGFVQPTVLVPTAHFTTAKQMIRFDGVPSQVGQAAACVAPGFACGGRPVVPPLYTATAQCRIVSGNWTFIDFASAPCREAAPDDRRFGFFAAVHGDGKPFGMLEALPKAKLAGLTLRRFADTVLANNPGQDFTAAGEHTYKSVAGATIRFRTGDDAAVLSTGNPAVDAQIAARSLATGSIANGDGARMTIVNPANGDSLHLDLTDRRNPVRTLDERDPLGRLLALGVDYSVAESDIRDWLTNEFTPYPSLSSALFTLLGDRKLRRLVQIDVINGFYEQTPGAQSPRTPAEVEPAILRAAILAAYNERYTLQMTSFDDLVR